MHRSLVALLERGRRVSFRLCCNCALELVGFNCISYLRCSWSLGLCMYVHRSLCMYVKMLFWCEIILGIDPFIIVLCKCMYVCMYVFDFYFSLFGFYHGSWRLWRSFRTIWVIITKRTLWRRSRPRRKRRKVEILRLLQNGFATWSTLSIKRRLDCEELFWCSGATRWDLTSCSESPQDIGCVVEFVRF